MWNDDELAVNERYLLYFFMQGKYFDPKILIFLL